MVRFDDADDRVARPLRSTDRAIVACTTCDRHVDSLRVTAAEPDARVALFADPQIEGLYREFVEGWWGVWNNRLNDMFQHHVYRSMMRASGARYGVVLGDLFSFQHLPIEEFLWRADRFNWIFSPYPDEGLIIVAGNHDIGYGSDMTQHLVDRWESEFGDVNAFYRIADHPVAVLNSMALDATRDYVCGTYARHSADRAFSLD